MAMLPQMQRPCVHQVKAWHLLLLIIDPLLEELNQDRWKCAQRARDEDQIHLPVQVQAVLVPLDHPALVLPPHGVAHINMVHHHTAEVPQANGFQDHLLLDPLRDGIEVVQTLDQNLQPGIGEVEILMFMRIRKVTDMLMLFFICSKCN